MRRPTTPPTGKPSLLAPHAEQTAALAGGPPILIVAVDTEAEFDWNGPFRTTDTSVRNLRNQIMAQNIFERFGVRPVYLVDYAVATQPEGYLPLREIAQSEGCEIGAHLHAWITPPHMEELGERTSFAHNLAAPLQQEKLARLTDAIEQSLGSRPSCYRAGRWGVGEEIADILTSLDYQIDMSVQPGIDMRRQHGPDFRRGGDRPYWFGRDLSLLEIPATPGFAGLLGQIGPIRRGAIELYNQLGRPGLDKLRIRGILARSGLLERLPASPEGVGLGELRRLTRLLLSGGGRVVVISYHSSSLLPGSTEYVQSAADLARFLRTIEGYLEFFMGELGGTALTPSGLRALLLAERRRADVSRSDESKRHATARAQPAAE